jgi:hypothetical protein
MVVRICARIAPSLRAALLRGYYLTGNEYWALATDFADDIDSTSFTSFSAEVHELIRTQPVAVLPTINAD